MANVVEIVIKGDDKSGGALRSAEEGMRKLGKTTATQAKNIRSSLQAMGTVASRLGGEQIQDAVIQVDALAIAARGVSEAFTRFGAARVAAYGTLAAAAAVGIKLVSDEIKKAELLEAAEKAVVSVQDELALSILQYSDAVEYSLQIEQQRYRLQNERIAALEKEGAQVEHLIQLNDSLNRGNREKIQNDSANKVNSMWSDVIGRQGKLVKSSSFGSSGSAGYQFYKPEQAAEVLALQRQYDAQLEAFKKYTGDKDEISKFTAAVEAQRSKDLAALNKRLMDEDLQHRLAKQREYAEQTSQFFDNLASAARAFGKEGFKAWQAFSIAKAIVDTYTAANAAYAALAGIPVIGPALGAAAAGAAIAAGLANVAVIASAKPPSAHGGATYVPEESTYLLNKGERVLAPRQNRDFTDFMERGGGQTIIVQIDGRKLGEALHGMSRDGRLRIDGRAIS